MFIGKSLMLGVTAGLIATASPALADEPVPATAPVAPPILLSLEDLSQTRGGQTVIVNNQTLTAITAGNSIGDYIAGAINFSDNALSNFTGIGNFTLNTGAQNNLQTGMILTINITN